MESFSVPIVMKINGERPHSDTLTQIIMLSWLDSGKNGQAFSICVREDAKDKKTEKKVRPEIVRPLQTQKV